MERSPQALAKTDYALVLMGCLMPVMGGGPNGKIYVVEWIREGRVTKLIADPTPAREGER